MDCAEKNTEWEDLYDEFYYEDDEDMESLRVRDIYDVVYGHEVVSNDSYQHRCP